MTEVRIPIAIPTPHTTECPDYAELVDRTLLASWDSARVELDAICTKADKLYTEGKLTVGEVGAIAGLVLTRSREIIADGPSIKAKARRKRRPQQVG